MATAKRPVSDGLVELWREMVAMRSEDLAEARAEKDPRRARSLRGQAGAVTHTLNNIRRVLLHEYDTSRFDEFEVSA